MPSQDHQQNGTMNYYRSTGPLPATENDVAHQTQDVSSVIRALPETKTYVPTTTSLFPDSANVRSPVLIRGTGRKSSSPRPPARRHRPVIQIGMMVVVALVILSALFTVIPVGKNGQSTLLKSIVGSTSGQMNISGVKGDNAPLIAQQAATATVVTQDGYDPGGNQTFAGVPTVAPGSINSGVLNSPGSTLGNFYAGQCTYWADMRYYELTGHWVTWYGNANQWYVGALNAGWVVSSQPHIHSIMVLQAGVEGAGGVGHVAVVESIPHPGIVHTSNWNWDGYWGVTTYVDFTYPVSGVSFVWYPGAS